MPSPFPGMNPYLETPELWSEVHSRLIVAIADIIAVPLRPNYYVAIEKRTYLSEPDDSVLVGIPDVSIFKERLHSPGSRRNSNVIFSPGTSHSYCTSGGGSAGKLPGNSGRH